MDNGHWHHSVTVLSVVGLHTQVGASTCARACQCTRQMSGCVKEGSWYKVSHHQRVSASPTSSHQLYCHHNAAVARRTSYKLQRLMSQSGISGKTCEHLRLSLSSSQMKDTSQGMNEWLQCSVNNLNYIIFQRSWRLPGFRPTSLHAVLWTCCLNKMWSGLMNLNQYATRSATLSLFDTMNQPLTLH